MQKIRYGIIVLWMLSCSVTPAAAQVSIGIGLPNVSIGINLPLFPELVRVPEYPVYYAPGVDYNYFFYDGMYWVFQGDNWYASSWYNGPWWLVDPYAVPLYILRVPVRYYRQPPVYFRGWRSNAPPRWGEHWGRGWEQRRSGWDRWRRGSAPAPAPLPVYQRQYTGDRYPRQVEQQQKIRNQQYRYQPRDTVVRKHYQQQGELRAPAPSPRGRQEEPRARSPRPQDTQRAMPPQQGGQAGRPQPQYEGPSQQRGPAPQDQRQQRAPAVQDQRRQPGAIQREQQEPRMRGPEQRPQGRGESQEPRGQGQGQRRDEERGR
ncbi:hypothetical protein AOG1_01290 [Geobacter sp. AOG1]|nr:hypothetical protein AOG1_01290 [Geobacter sp. AOG1]